MPDSLCGKVSLVIGNEAADADSCISALLWAFHLSLSSDTSTLVFPVVSCAAKDLVLRREFTFLLSQSLDMSGESVESTHDALSAFLICSDAVLNALPWLELLIQRRKLAVILTDHNKICTEFAVLGEAVAAIVDHHFDMGAHEVSINEYVLLLLSLRLLHSRFEASPCSHCSLCK